MIRRRLNASPVIMALAALCSSSSGTASAHVVPVRTVLASDPPGPDQADGASANPVLSADGRVVVFDTAATNFVLYDLNGAVRDVVAVDLASGSRLVVSAGADGPSSSPAVSADGARVAFVSRASTFTAPDNGMADIFVRDRDGPVALVSASANGGPADGPSSEPDISADGRNVVFTSSAANLVAGDRNRQPDVFVRDLVTRRTRLVSASSGGVPGNRASSAPAISADGRVVSFASQATNLVRRDTNGVGDVFARNIATGVTRRVSVATGGGQQNRAVAAPFVQISDLSSDGRFVVFDSEASNLIGRDANRRADVFRRDLLTGRTTLISASSTNRQGNNDSVSPTITPDGRHVAFQSFASNLAPGNARGEDVFVRDLRTRTTTVAGVPAAGGTRGPELVAQLLQWPALAADGSRAAFTSTAPGLAGADANRFEDVFVRLLAPPRGRVVRPPRPAPRPSLVLAADDPHATHFACRIDDSRLPFICPMGTMRLPRGLGAGRHVLYARAGGPGMLYDPLALRVPVTVTGRGR